MPQCYSISEFHDRLEVNFLFGTENCEEHFMPLYIQVIGDEWKGFNTACYTKENLVSRQCVWLWGFGSYPQLLFHPNAKNEKQNRNQTWWQRIYLRNLLFSGWHERHQGRLSCEDGTISGYCFSSGRCQPARWASIWGALFLHRGHLRRGGCRTLIIKILN